MHTHPTGSILLIDDDEDDRFFMALAVKASTPAYTLCQASSGQQALDLLTRLAELPDLILLDLNMPGLSGFDVLTQIRQSVAWAHLPVVIFTTSREALDQARAVALGATAFISKPATYTGLDAIVMQLAQYW